MECAKGVRECVGALHPFVTGGLLDGLSIVAGIWVIILATGLAIRTFMIPDPAPPLINRLIFRATQAIFNPLSRVIRNPVRKHQVLSLFAPTSLLVVLGFILFLIGTGYTLVYFGIGIRPLIRAFLFSGSALSTLGFESPGNNFWVIMLSATEALTVAVVVSLLIGYLPGIYSSYQAREQAVRTLDDLTGTPPDGVKVVDAYVAVYGSEKLGDLWQTWLGWFSDLGTSGSTLSGQLYLRSSSWDRSWICTAGAMLDAASLVDSSVDSSTDPAANHLVRSGSKALAQVLEPLRLHCPPNPIWPKTPINITRAEFDEAYDHLQQSGLPMKPDRDAAWTAFAQHRVTYECPLMTLVKLKKPPRGARWTTDRDEGKGHVTIPIRGRKRVGHHTDESTEGTPTAP
jgi:hypothetical protein